MKAGMLSWTSTSATIIPVSLPALKQVQHPLMRIIPKASGSSYGTTRAGRHLAEGYAKGAGAWSLHATGVTSEGAAFPQPAVGAAPF